MDLKSPRVFEDILGNRITYPFLELSKNTFIEQFYKHGCQNFIS